jgi:tetratricopeptide (TPR) repeat protein
MQFVDFNIQLDTDGNKLVATYVHPRGRVIRGAATPVPFNEFVVENIRLTVEKEGQRAALAAPAAGRRAPGHRSAANAADAVLQQHGAELFSLLFSDPIGTEFRDCYRRARAAKKGLRLRIRTGPDLAMYPFEILFSHGPPLQGAYLALRSRLAIVRSLINADEEPRKAIAPPLRILVVKASPDDPHYTPIDPENHELDTLRKALALPGIEVHVVRGPDTWGQLIAPPISELDIHVLHFMGHGDYNEKLKHGTLIFEDPDSRAAAATAAQIADLLDGFPSLRLVVLNSCKGNVGNKTQISSAVAMSVFGLGVPAVVAMQYEITEPAALEFSRAFYSQLAFGRPVDHALTLARSAVQFRIPNSPEWVTPVLYLATPDGDLFGLRLSAEDLLEHARVRLCEREWVTASNVASLVRRQHPKAKECAEAEVLEKIAEACERFWQALTAAAEQGKNGQDGPGQEAFDNLKKLAMAFPRDDFRKRELNKLPDYRELFAGLEAFRAFVAGKFDDVLDQCGKLGEDGGELLGFLVGRVKREQQVLAALQECKRLLLKGDWASFGKVVEDAFRQQGKSAPLELLQLHQVWICLKGAMEEAAAANPNYHLVASRWLAKVSTEFAPSNLDAARKIAGIGKQVPQATSLEKCDALEKELAEIGATPEGLLVPFLPGVRALLATQREQVLLDRQREQELAARERAWADITRHMEAGHWDEAIGLLEERRKAEPGNQRIEAWLGWCSRAPRLLPLLEKMAVGPVADPTLSFTGQADDRLLAEFFLYRVAQPDRVAALVQRLSAVAGQSEPGLTPHQIVAELHEDGGIFLVLQRLHDEAMTFFLGQARQTPDDPTALHHLALASAARIYLHQKGADPLAPDDLEPAWEQLILAWSVVLVDGRFWSRWCARCQEAPPQSEGEALLAGVRRRLEDEGPQLLSLSFAAEQEEAFLAEVRGARAAQAGGGIPRANLDARVVVGPLGARVLGLVEEVQAWSRSVGARGDGTPWQDRVGVFFSELNEPAAVLEVGRPERALTLLSRRAGSPGPALGAWWSARQDGDELFRSAALSLQTAAHLRLGWQAVDQSPVDQGGALNHWCAAVALAQQNGQGEQVLEQVRQAVLYGARQLCHPDRATLPSLNQAVELLFLVRAQGWDGPDEPIKRALVDALLDRAVHLFNKYQRLEAERREGARPTHLDTMRMAEIGQAFAAARRDSLRAYGMDPNYFRAIHSYCHSTTFYALYKCKIEGEQALATDLLSEAEVPLEHGEKLSPNWLLWEQRLLEQCRQNFDQVRQIVAGGTAPASSGSLDVPPLKVEGPIGPFGEGILYESQGKYEIAIQCFQEIPIDDPLYREARGRMAECLGRLCEQSAPDHLPRLVARALATCPEFASLNRNLVARVLATGREEFLAECRRAGVSEEVVAALLKSFRNNHERG